MNSNSIEILIFFTSTSALTALCSLLPDTSLWRQSQALTLGLPAIDFLLTSHLKMLQSKYSPFILPTSPLLPPFLLLPWGEVPCLHFPGSMQVYWQSHPLVLPPGPYTHLLLQPCCGVFLPPCPWQALPFHVTPTTPSTFMAHKSQSSWLQPEWVFQQPVPDLTHCSIQFCSNVKYRQIHPYMY